jgi:hypothetical protein
MGERYAQLESQVFVHGVQVTSARIEAAAVTGDRMGLSAAEVLASPHALVGSVEQLTEDLLERRELYGFSYVSIPVDAVDAFAPVVARLVGT